MSRCCAITAACRLRRIPPAQVVHHILYSRFSEVISSKPSRDHSQIAKLCWGQDCLASRCRAMRVWRGQATQTAHSEYAARHRHPELTCYTYINRVETDTDTAATLSLVCVPQTGSDCSIDPAKGTEAGTAPLLLARDAASVGV